MSGGQVLMGEEGVDLERAYIGVEERARVHFAHARVVRDDQATETNVRTIEPPLVLRMATHGFFGEALNERDNPLFRSGLYLADIDQVEDDCERDDGQLTAYEVSGMDLRGTQLVVLSSYKTGLDAPVEAEGKKSRGTKRRWCFLWDRSHGRPRKSHRRLRATVVARPSPRIVCLAALQIRGGDDDVALR